MERKYELIIHIWTQSDMDTLSFELCSHGGTSLLHKGAIKATKTVNPGGTAKETVSLRCRNIHLIEEVLSSRSSLKSRSERTPDRKDRDFICITNTDG